MSESPSEERYVLGDVLSLLSLAPLQVRINMENSDVVVCPLNYPSRQFLRKNWADIANKTRDSQEGTHKEVYFLLERLNKSGIVKVEERKECCPGNPLPPNIVAYEYILSV